MDKPEKGTVVYGASDDLIEFAGELEGEVGAYDPSDNSDENNRLGKLVAFSDGTILAIRYGKPANGGVWAIDVLRRGDLFERKVECNDDDADPYSDQVFFKPGKLKAWAADSGEIVR